MFWKDLRFGVNHRLGSGDAEAFIDELQKDPTALSPFTIPAGKRGSTTYGYPIPLPNARIGVTVTGRETTERKDGSKTVALSVRYRDAFEGPGRIVANQDRHGNLTVRDEWDGVSNRSGIPSLAVEMGHSAVVDMGFRNILRKTKDGRNGR